ncbi:recombinase family protein [Phototrophicus methaneseepsis]|uniref:Recombinase family protein n=1 Tax=Phototrophicus methaneseepsis TaxID=2710758 RepID=A0A7S8IG70_9CHLR|nr:recombinase family protein [Phototrophicus methaneseepsis]QPC83683.1 recombinase family protein [Phototrophicus methaneseepsis]
MKKLTVMLRRGTPHSSSDSPPRPGWAIYLRTSSREAQNPKNSQKRQRHNINQALTGDSDMQVVDEYIDVMSGRTPNRADYQRLLSDARLGRFSHVAVENAERFGRNDTEALVAIDELHALGIAVRFADYPDLDPIDPDDRILIALSFVLARRESIKLGQRVRGGLHAKLRSGGCVGLAPDGYRNVMDRDEQNVLSGTGRVKRWIEPDPEQFQVWREAWDLLLSEQHTLTEICEALHAKGYRYRSGRPFVEIKNEMRKAANNTLSKRFHNWFYAGWIVSPKAGIAPKTIRGNWKPVVTTEEFERGLAIVAKRTEDRPRKRRHQYLLSGLIYYQKADGKRRIRMTCSTSNPARKGGIAYYRIAGTRTRFLCKEIDRQLMSWLCRIQVDSDYLPAMRAAYTTEIAEKMGHLQPDRRREMETALKGVDEEEARTLRLFAAGKITEHVWDALWLEWQDRRRTLRANLAAMAQEEGYHIKHLDDALGIIAKVSIIFGRMDLASQKKLLKEMIHRVVVNQEGQIIDVELFAPFGYLQQLNTRIEGEKVCESVESVAKCSNKVSSGPPRFVN